MERANNIWSYRNRKVVSFSSSTVGVSDLQWGSKMFLIPNSYFLFLLLHDTHGDMNHKSWVTSCQFQRFNLAKEPFFRNKTLFSILVLGHYNPKEQLSEGLAKQFIKLDRDLGQVQTPFWFSFPHTDFQEFVKSLSTTMLLQVFMMTISGGLWGILWELFPFIKSSLVTVELNQCANLSHYRQIMSHWSLICLNVILNGS